MRTPFFLLTVCFNTCGAFYNNNGDDQYVYYSMSVFCNSICYLTVQPWVAEVLLLQALYPEVQEDGVRREAREEPEPVPAHWNVLPKQLPTEILISFS